METSTATRTEVGRQLTPGGDAAARAARVWLIRRLGWERRLTELRTKVAGR